MCVIWQHQNRRALGVKISNYYQNFLTFKVKKGIRWLKKSNKAFFLSGYAVFAIQITISFNLDNRVSKVCINFFW